MNPEIKFAIVREDPAVDLAVVERARAMRVLFVASGGCPLLEIAHRFPEVDVVGFDFNPAQLEHVRAKISALERADLRSLNVGDSDPRALNQRGSFEGLFRVLRQAIIEFVADEETLERFFHPGADETTPSNPADTPTQWFLSPYWPVCFELAFHHPLLDAMFTEAATQNAAPGSYPRYFQRVFERGLLREDARRNPFLQHILLGRYHPLDAPGYIEGAGKHHDLTLVQGALTDVEDIGSFDVIQLSNIFDWSSDALVERWCKLLREQCKPGCHVILRQLNNTRDLRQFFGDAFVFEEELANQLLDQDRSLFYNRIEIARRVG